MKVRLKVRELIAILSMLLVSCSVRVDELSFTRSDGPPVLLHTRRTLLRTETPATALYRLEQPVRVGAGPNAFFLTYWGPLRGSQLEIYAENGELVRSAALRYSSAIPLRYTVKMPIGSTVGSFRVRMEEGASDARLLGVGLAETFYGFRLQHDVLEVGEVVAMLPPGLAAGEPATLPSSVDLSDAVGEIERGAFWQVALAFRSIEGPPVKSENEIVTVSLIDRDSARTAELTVRMNAQETTVFLYQGLIGFVPAVLEVAEVDGRGRIGLIGCEVSFGLLDEIDPVPADAGSVLAYDQAAWRRRDFEVFSWDLHPEILIFDTADYKTQSRLFKRLAFFVEKRGYVGTIPDWQSIAHLHGYNAHDYRSEDLAAFFEHATRERVALLEEERRLREILLASGVIRFSDGSYLPGDGGLVSISQDSYRLLRLLLLTHECLHGVFFSLPTYRNRCYQIWDDLSEGERWFWRLFLRWAGYDVENRYLVVNEYQAYVLQQNIRNVDSYLGDVVVGRLIESYPDQKQRILSFRTAYPDSFRSSHTDLEAALWDEAQLTGGRVLLVESERKADE